MIIWSPIGLFDARRHRHVAQRARRSRRRSARSAPAARRRSAGRTACARSRSSPSATEISFFSRRMSSSSSSISRIDLIAVPQHLQAELELVLHLVEHVAERVVGRPQQLDDVVARLEHRAERHRDDGVLAHHRLVDALVREHVLARRSRAPRAACPRRPRRGPCSGRCRRRPARRRCRAARSCSGSLRLDDAVDVLALGCASSARRRRRRASRARSAVRGIGTRSSLPRAALRGGGRPCAARAGGRRGRAASCARGCLPDAPSLGVLRHAFGLPVGWLAQDRLRMLAASRAGLLRRPCRDASQHSLDLRDQRVGQARLGDERVAAGLPRAFGDARPARGR